MNAPLPSFVIPSDLVAKLSLEGGGGAVSESRIRLLEAIAACGSISQAARRVPLSYKAAWEALDALNALAPQPLVVRVSTGRQGGGTELTDYGRHIVALYRALEIETQQALVRVQARLAAGNTLPSPAGLAVPLSDATHTSQVQSSARNQFAGPIVGMRDGAVDFEVRVQVSPSIDIVAVITRRSAERMQLTMGQAATALVKASSVLLSIDDQFDVSARNRLRGVITSIDVGSLNNEVCVELPSGHKVTALVTQRSCARMGLQLGMAVTACFKASSVIVACQAAA